MTATHNVDIQISKSIQPAAPESQGFGLIAYLSDGSLDPGNGDIYRQVTPQTNLSDLVTAGTITQDAADAMNTIFSQTPTPPRAAIIGLDTSGSDTYSSIVQDAISAGHPFYGVIPDTETPADVSSLASTIESTDKLMAADVGGADWLTDGVPTDYTSLTENLRFAPMYHPDAANTYVSPGWFGSRLVFDPDVQSAAFTGSVTGVSPYPEGSKITVDERSEAHDNGANTLLPFGSSNTYVKPGQNIAGNPLYEIVTIDWFAARLENRLAALQQRRDAAGEKLGVDQDGQAAFVGEIEAQIDAGIEADHFVDEKSNGVNDVQAPTPIPDADKENQRLSATVFLQFKVSANTFQVNLNFTRS